MHDPNADLIGYEFTNYSEGGSRWRVIGSDAVLGVNYVELRRVDDDGNIDSSRRGMRVQPVATVRRRRQLEQEVRAWADESVASC
jgi:hypothetical protein